jgi:hypothetical protein
MAQWWLLLRMPGCVAPSQRDIAQTRSLDRSVSEGRNLQKSA